jgi:hypothetical protein
LLGVTKEMALLGAARAMTAGLHTKFGERFVPGQCYALKAQLARWSGIHKRLLGNGKGLSICGSDKVAELLQNLKSERLIFAGCQFGPPLVSVAALSSLGANVAGVYWALGKTQRQILDKCRVRAIDMTGQTNRFALIRLLQGLQADGYIVWLMCDVPGKSRERYNFLGYKVRCANLIEVFARLSHSTVVPTYCRMISEDVSVHCDAPLTDYSNMTQRLLSNVETLIYEDPMNYLWDGTSIIFSDPQALQNGLNCLPDFLEWRERSTARHERWARASVPPCRRGLPE